MDKWFFITLIVCFCSLMATIAIEGYVKSQTNIAMENAYTECFKHTTPAECYKFLRGN